MAHCNDAFSGLTVAFRNTPEFKDLSALIRKAYPAWPEYLVDTAICMHIQHPRVYRDAKAKVVSPVVCPDRAGAFAESVKIYSDATDIPAQDVVMTDA